MSNKTTYTVDLYGDKYSIRANWEEASCPIERNTEDGWKQTGMQVANFGHSFEEAMEAEEAVS